MAYGHPSSLATLARLRDPKINLLPRGVAPRLARFARGSSCLVPLCLQSTSHEYSALFKRCGVVHVSNQKLTATVCVNLRALGGRPAALKENRALLQNASRLRPSLLGTPALAPLRGYAGFPPLLILSTARGGSPNGGFAPACGLRPPVGLLSGCCPPSVETPLRYL